MDFKVALKKIISVFEEEQIPYMIVGGLALSYYNRYRFTANIDCVIQIYSFQVGKIVKHFPDWLPFLSRFEENLEKGLLFNITDFETGIRYDFMPYQDSAYDRTAFERRKAVPFFEIRCFIASPEDLLISKLRWYAISKSGKQLDDIKFLLQEESLDRPYLEIWVNRLNMLRHGLF